MGLPYSAKNWGGSSNLELRPIDLDAVNAAYIGEDSFRTSSYFFSSNVNYHPSGAKRGSVVIRNH